MVGSLFDEPGDFDRTALAGKLRALADENICIGGSSWKYEGWLGQIYSRERYLSRGRFSRKLFEAECLREYAETFPTVCGDFAFYQFPGEEFWRKLFAQVPGPFRFAFKVPEQITCKVFPSHARYGPHAGQQNGEFLNARLLYEMFLRPLMPYRAQTAVLIFEFGAFSPRAMSGVNEFVERLAAFLEALPRGADSRPQCKFDSFKLPVNQNSRIEVGQHSGFLQSLHEGGLAGRHIETGDGADTRIFEWRHQAPQVIRLNPHIAVADDQMLVGGFLH